MDEEDARPRKSGAPLRAVLLIVVGGIAAIVCTIAILVAVLG
jgi:hypothetical protein